MRGFFYVCQTKLPRSLYMAHLLEQVGFFIPRQIIIFTYAPIPQAIGNIGVLVAMAVTKGCNWR